MANVSIGYKTKYFRKGRWVPLVIVKFSDTFYGPE